jgi:hypothetical protein
VVTASLLVKLLAVLGVLSSLISIVGLKDVIYKDSDGEEIDNNLAGATGVIGLLIAIAIAVAFFFLAASLLRGNSTARTITWVLCGLVIFCNLCGVCGTAVGPDEHGVPGWYRVWEWLAILGSLGLAIAIVALLATPAANVFFKPAPLVPPPGAGPMPPMQ